MLEEIEAMAYGGTWENEVLDDFGCEAEDVQEVYPDEFGEEDVQEVFCEEKGAQNVFMGFQCPSCGREWTGRGSSVDDLIDRATYEKCPNKCSVSLINAHSIVSFDKPFMGLDSNLFAEMLSDGTARMEPQIIDTASPYPWLAGYVKVSRFHGGII